MREWPASGLPGATFPLACRVECLEVTVGGRESPWLMAYAWAPRPVALGSQGLDPPSPALDFVLQSKLALKHKVSEGAGHDDDV
jgi:hypothetical protein